jgi:hypothetical protein
MSVQDLNTVDVAEIKPRRRPRRRRVRDGVNVAVLAALCAARQVLDRRIPSAGEASRACGANKTYTSAAVILLQAKNSAVVAEVLAGERSLLSAAREVAGMVKLVRLFDRSSPEDRVAFAIRVATEYRLHRYWCERHQEASQIFRFDQA